MGHVVVPGKHTWGEAIQRNNDARRIIVASSSPDRLSYNIMLLAKDEASRFKPVPDDIARARPLYSGTAGAVGPKNKSWKTIETQCQFGEKMAGVVFDAGAQQEAEVMLTRNHGFAPDGTPNVGFYTPDNNGVKGKLVKLYNAQGNQIEQMPDSVFLRFNGKASQVRIQSRNGGVLEIFNGENVYSYVSDSAVLGLLRRGYGFYVYGGRHFANLDEGPSYRLRVAIEAIAESNALGELATEGCMAEGGAPREATGPACTITDSQFISKLNDLAANGTPVQREAASRLIETFKQ